MPNVPLNLGSTFATLAELVYGGDSYDAVYETVCLSAVELIDGCDHASLMLRRRGRDFTPYASDDTARFIDELEREHGEGPCVDAMDDDEPDAHCCPDLSTGSQWPGLAEQIVTRTPVRGMAGFRIRRPGEAKAGALNIFSDTPGALTAVSLDQASLLTAFASVALAAMENGDEAATLRRGLESNREIGKAVGLLMAMHDLEDDQAFAMLARLSQDLNIKLADVARRVLEHRQSERSAAAR